MKQKNILRVSVLGLCTYLALTNLAENQYSDLLLQNTEVLASGEGGTQKGDAVDDYCNHTYLETGEICNERITLCLANKDIPCSQSICEYHQK